jgi:hypothetical protein
MRRAAALLVLLALGVAGCGGHEHDQTGGLDDAVGYFAKDAPLVAAVQTDPDGDQIKQVKNLLGRFPGSSIISDRLLGLTHLTAARWGSDIRPQLGAPLVVGVNRPAARRAAVVARLVLAMRVKDPVKVKQLLVRQPGFRGSAQASGVRVYANAQQRRYVAVDGDVVVAATTRATLEQALAVKRGDRRMRASGFGRDVAGLPSGGLVQISADPRALIAADPRLRPALGVKWIDSLRRLGAVLKVSDSGITFDVRAATESSSLSDGDLPLAPKRRPLPLIGRLGELQMAVQEPSRLARFVFQVENAIGRQHMARLRALEPGGIDLEQQIPHHLGKLGQLATDPTRHAFAFRADLNDPNDVQTSLAVLAPRLPSLAELFGLKGIGVATPEAGESFYALAKPSGGTTVFGVIGETLVAATEAPRAARLASAPTHQAPGDPRGAAVVTMDARTLAVKLLAKRLSGAAALFAPLAVAALRDLTGVLTISRSGLDGHFKLTIVK